MKGTERNKPCPCGSGKKAKRCEHPTRSPYEGVRVTTDPVSSSSNGETRVRRRMSPMLLATIASVLAVPPVRR